MATHRCYVPSQARRAAVLCALPRALRPPPSPPPPPAAQPPAKRAHEPQHGLADSSDDASSEARSVRPRRHMPPAHSDADDNDHGLPLSLDAAPPLPPPPPPPGANDKALVIVTAVAPPPSQSQPACTVCCEEQVVGLSNAAAAAALDKVMGVREVIFGFYTAMAGHQCDESIFERMLLLRQTLVERHLEAHGVPYARWTLPALRAHYAVHGGHRFDYTREVMDELDAARRACAFMDRSMMYVATNNNAPPPMDPANSADASGGGNPPAGAPPTPALNLRVLESRLKMGKHRADMARLVDQRLSAAASVDYMQRLIAAVHAAAHVGRPGAAQIADLADANLVDLYTIGASA